MWDTPHLLSMSGPVPAIGVPGIAGRRFRIYVPRGRILAPSGIDA
jgi:hypothetical protein